jgi:hypothetical protein
VKGIDKRGDSKAADKNIKYCKYCNKCWEIQLMNNFRKKERKIIYYDDFPNYGKIKQTCDTCKGKNNVKNVMDKLFVREQPQG